MISFSTWGGGVKSVLWYFNHYICSDSQTKVRLRSLYSPTTTSSLDTVATVFLLRIDKSFTQSDPGESKCHKTA